MKHENNIKSDLLEFENELYINTKSLIVQVTSTEISEISLISFKLSQIYTLRCNFDLYLKINYQYQHHEFISLISFWDSTFIELKRNR